jgi:hypothetical protein
VAFIGVNLGTSKVKQMTASGYGVYMQNNEVCIAMNENTVVTHLTYMLTHVIQSVANKVEGIETYLRLM